MRDVQLMIRVEASLRERLEAHRRLLAAQHLKLSLAAVARMALAEGLDALERKGER